MTPPRSRFWTCLTEGCPIHGRQNRTPDGMTARAAFEQHYSSEHGGGRS